MDVAIASPSETVQQAGSFHELGIIGQELAQVLDRHFGIAKFCQH